MDPIRGFGYISVCPLPSGLSAFGITRVHPRPPLLFPAHPHQGEARRAKPPGGSTVPFPFLLSFPGFFSSCSVSSVFFCMFTLSSSVYCLSPTHPTRVHLCLPLFGTSQVSVVAGVLAADVGSRTRSHPSIPKPSPFLGSVHQGAALVLVSNTRPRIAGFGSRC